MCAMERRTSKSSMGATFRARLATLAGLVAFATAALAPAGAAAEGITESAFGPRMSLAFSKDSAKVVGDKALVAVKCLGPQEGTCVGTVSLSLDGATHKVPFSVLGGHRQNLVVPLGCGEDGPAAGTARALASTVQPLGASREAERTLRLR
jgi:hypothetical protein